LGESSVGIFKILFLACIFLGSIINLGAIVDFSDMMLLATAIPNLIGCMLLSGKVARDLKDYWKRLNCQKSSLKSYLNSERSLIN
jgi:AGCS family alanine or glycine:cation symporter